MKNLTGLIAALAAGVGAGAAGALPDPEQIAKLGPIAGALVIYTELRILPLIRELITVHKAARDEHKAERAELAAVKAALPTPPAPSSGVPEALPANG